MQYNFFLTVFICNLRAIKNLIYFQVLVHLTKNSVFTSVREFKESLSNTLIYESILIKHYVNANIMNTQIFHLIKYNLNVNFIFILTLTYVLLDNFLSLFIYTYTVEYS